MPGKGYFVVFKFRFINLKVMKLDRLQMSPRKLYSIASMHA